MSASWRKPSRTLKKRTGLGNDKSSLAIDDIRHSGGTPNFRVPQESGPGPLLAVVKRAAQILIPFSLPMSVGIHLEGGASRPDDCLAGGLVHDGPVHSAI